MYHDREGIGIVRLSKALKWYFFYICLVLMAIFLFSLYPKIVSVLLTLNTVVYPFSFWFLFFLSTSLMSKKSDIYFCCELWTRSDKLFGEQLAEIKWRCHESERDEG